MFFFYVTKENVFGPFNPMIIWTLIVILIIIIIVIGCLNFDSCFEL